MAPGTSCLTLPELLALLWVLFTGAGGTQVSVHPKNVVIPQGGSVQVNCSASCNSLGLETQLTKVELTNGDNWKVFLLSDVQEDSSPICFSNCDNKQSIASMNLSVYSFPELVDLAPLPLWQPVGKNLTLHCKVVGGAPQALLTVVLLRGEKELKRQPVAGKTTEVPFTMLVEREDHGADFSCRTELDLRPHGLGLLENSSAPRQLRTYDLPKTLPSLATPKFVEVGKEWSVNCSLEGLFPASEAEIGLILGNQSLHPTVKHKKDALMAWVQVKVEEEGVQQLKCTVMLGGQSLEKAETVTFYSFPAPSLTLSAMEVSEGTGVTVECKAQTGLRAVLSGAPDGPPASRAQFTLKARAEDDKRQFFCSAVLDIAGQVLYKNQTQELRVLYGPRLDESDCPGNWTWEEGSYQTLKCQPWGNPPPMLDCRRNGDKALLPIGELKPVKQEIQGSYRCRAVSSQGEVIREVLVTVIYHQNYVAIIVVILTVFVLTVGLAAWFYNRQRKIQKYKLQKAQEAIKLNKPATPP
ncbi:PREDICTED: intercellular adhesion molecule 1 [Condylura cristata]|uniref:intercellular adhesion molecule 1 n=1 Tax=Condylura cristata TaxID=143302 RepID=UPI00033465A8|nr:PREDICTED: intercellular adhesion molecule 1 [Condylura cristata]